MVIGPTVPLQVTFGIESEFRRTASMSRVLVVGGTGKLGRAVVRELKRRKYWVRVLIRETSIRADEMKRAIALRGRRTQLSHSYIHRYR